MAGDEHDDEALLTLAVHMEAKKSARERTFDAMPTAGLEAIMIRFSDAPPTRWVEATGEDGEPLLGSDAFSFWLADEDRVAKSAKVMTKGIALALEDSYDDGLALADLRGDGDSESGALVVYVGECCRQERVFWGLEAGGTPAVLIAAFEYA